MSKIANGLLGIAAGALAFGAVQLEHATSGTLPAALPQGDASLRALHDVERAGKADRLGRPDDAEASATMFVYPVTMPDMLIVARVVRSKPAAAPVKKAPEQKSNAAKIACEPLMSALVAEAETLQPGRCLV